MLCRDREEEGAEVGDGWAEGGSNAQGYSAQPVRGAGMCERSSKAVWGVVWLIQNGGFDDSRRASQFEMGVLGQIVSIEFF